MKRFHVHVAVPDLAGSIRFYSTLFGAEPAVTKPDYAKWMLEDPRVNFAISQRGADVGLNHLGFQVDSGEELAALHGQLEAADRGVVAETGANCCYAKSDKYWVKDPAGIAWESFHTLGAIPLFGGADAEQDAASACCAPGADASQAAPAASACCAPAATAGNASRQSGSACCSPAPAAAEDAAKKATQRAACCG
ncbi:MAG: VOC family protein [Burkholderiales bacterium]|nr:VOC family protein [Burkholderiales bacterium]